MAEISVQVEQTYNNYPPEAKAKLLRLRELLLETAKKIPEVGPIEETLKWEQPSYLTSKTKTGSTIRFGWSAKSPSCVSVFFNCKTTIIDTCRDKFPNELQYIGNREIRIPITETISEDAISQCFAIALMYHKNKKN